MILLVASDGNPIYTSLNKQRNLLARVTGNLDSGVLTMGGELSLCSSRGSYSIYIGVPLV